jgi:hypothetical protein
MGVEGASESLASSVVPLRLSALERVEFVIANLGWIRGDIVLIWCETVGSVGIGLSGWLVALLGIGWWRYGNEESEWRRFGEVGAAMVAMCCKKVEGEWVCASDVWYIIVQYGMWFGRLTACHVMLVSGGLVNW